MAQLGNACAGDDKTPPREKYYKLLGYNFRQRRMMQQITVAMVARRTKIPAARIREFEAGNYEIPIHDMFRMLAAIGIDRFSHQVANLHTM